MPRLTIRRIMLLVAILAVLMASGILTSRLWALSARYRHRANASLEEVRLLRENLKAYDAGTVVGRNITQAEVDRLAVWFRKLLPYHEARARKYDYAARHPWIAVPPDPPQPEK